jgi:hypothetical protein
MRSRRLEPARRPARASAWAIRELVLDDQRVRNEICWSVFDC